MYLSHRTALAQHGVCLAVLYSSHIITWATLIQLAAVVVRTCQQQTGRT